MHFCLIVGRKSARSRATAIFRMRMPRSDIVFELPIYGRYATSPGSIQVVPRQPFSSYSDRHWSASAIMLS